MVGPKELWTRLGEARLRNPYREKAQTAANSNLWSISLCWFFSDPFFLTLTLYNVSSPFLHHWQRKIYLKRNKQWKKRTKSKYCLFHYYCALLGTGVDIVVSRSRFEDAGAEAPSESEYLIHHRTGSGRSDPGNQVTRVRTRVRRSTREMPPAANQKHCRWRRKLFCRAQTCL